MKSLKDLAVHVLNEIGQRCAVETTMDRKTLVRRIEHESEAFLTISLPTFGKAFEQALAAGHVDPNLWPPGWRVRNGAPVFLQGFLSQVFDLSSGNLLEVPSVDAIHAVRQLTLMFAKVKIPTTSGRSDRALREYLDTDRNVGSLDRTRSVDRVLDFRHMATLLWARLFADVSNTLYADGVVPKHGGGATANRLSGNQKYTCDEWTNRLEHCFPWLENGAASWSQYQDVITFRSPGAERPVKVITVPKTLTTPRIIAEEPSYMQYMQQGLLELLREGIRRDSFARNFVCFDSQVPNQQLARRGSIDGSLATLDLSEASDRVSIRHVADLLHRNGLLRKAVFACRSTKAEVLGETHRLAKFASMGSALTFPLESLVFATIVFIGIQRALGYNLGRRDVKSYFGRVRIYGDDIIVPTEFAPSVIETLEDYGLKVNRSKSFLSGKFRESCGSDWYNGYDVKVVRVRQPLPHDRRDSVEIVSLSSLRNQLYLAGFDRTVRAIDKRLLELLGGHYPYVGEQTGVIGRVTNYDPSLTNEDRVLRRDPRLQVTLVRGYKLSALPPPNQLDGYGALLKFFLKRSNQPLEETHLTHSGRPKTVRLMLRWVSL